MGNIGKATEPRINNQWQPTQVTDICLTVLCTPFINRFMYRQHVPVYEKERWLFDKVVDHVGIYWSKGAEGLSAFNAALVKICNFDIVLFWLGIWSELLVWVIMGSGGYLRTKAF